MSSSLWLCKYMLAACLLVTFLQNTHTAPLRQRRDLLDDLDFADFMDNDFGSDWAKAFGTLEEDVQKLRNGMQKEMHDINNKYHVDQMPINHSKTFKEVKDKNGKKEVTNTTITKEIKDGNEREVISETKAIKGNDGKSYSVIMHGSFSNPEKLKEELEEKEPKRKTKQLQEGAAEASANGVIQEP